MIKSVLAVLLLLHHPVAPLVPQPTALHLMNDSKETQRVWVHTNCSKRYGWPYGPLEANWGIPNHTIINFYQWTTCLENPKKYIDFWIGIDDPKTWCAFRYNAGMLWRFEGDKKHCAVNGWFMERAYGF